jgi:hypothetical protein
MMCVKGETRALLLSYAKAECIPVRGCLDALELLVKLAKNLLVKLAS